MGFVIKDHGDRLPHDLTHLAIESDLGIDPGFWVLISRGAIFRGMRRVGGHGKVGSGRRVVERTGAGMDQAELLVAAVAGLWEHGSDPISIGALEAGSVAACFVTLDRLQSAWASTGPGQCLAIDWSPPAGHLAVLNH